MHDIVWFSGAAHRNVREPVLLSEKRLQKDPLMTRPSLMKRALHHPQSVFETPEAVVQSQQLPREDKRTILERWRQLIDSPPTREGTPAGEPSLATRLTRALAFLDTETGSHEVTHNQGFLYLDWRHPGESPNQGAVSTRPVVVGNGRTGPARSRKAKPADGPSAAHGASVSIMSWHSASSVLGQRSWCQEWTSPAPRPSCRLCQAMREEPRPLVRVRHRRSLWRCARQGGRNGSEDRSGSLRGRATGHLFR